MKDVHSIMLVDDDSMTTFINKRLLKKIGYQGSIIDFQYAQNALDYLRDSVKMEINSPDIILMDINMPGMDGWEFLDQYSKIEGLKKQINIFMLSMSLNPADKLKSANYKMVTDFLPKPLTEGELPKIFEKHARI